MQLANSFALLQPYIKFFLVLFFKIIAAIINSSIFYGPSQFGIAMMLVMFDVDGEIGVKFDFFTSKILFETNIGFNLSSLILLPFVSLLFVTTTFLSLPLSLSQSFDPFFSNVIMQLKWHELRI